MAKKYCIGNTHFDPVWLWTWDEAMASIRATFRSALQRMEEDPDFVYSFATPPVFDWIKETAPALFDEICARVKEGRWELGEGWWLQPDCYSASGESYVRQGLYGQRWLMENFGRTADTVFNIDSFGHSPMLPQILAKSGIRNYAFVRPEKHHVQLASPLFWWEAPDGSRVLTYRAEGCYEKNMTARLAHDAAEDEMIVFGVTDHGGAPTKEALAAIHDCPDAFCSTLTKFFDDHSTYSDEQSACTNIEKREFITGDFGPYANLPQIKAEVRRCEYSLTNAEKALALAGENDSCGKLRSSWEDVLFQQFHDIFGGACIKDAYRDAFAGLGRAWTTSQRLLHTTLQKLTAKLHVTGKLWNLVVWNLNGGAYDGPIEAEVQWIHEFDWYSGGIALEDENGGRIPCQVIREKSVLPGFRSRFLFRGVIPAMGYRVYKVIQTGEKSVSSTEHITGDVAGSCQIETERLTVTLENGVITSLLNKETGVRLGKLFVPAAFEDAGDTWAFNIQSYDPTPIPWENLSVEVKEAGPIRTVIRSHFRLGLSTLTLYYTIPHDGTNVEVRWVCHWNDRFKAVKLLCDTPESAHVAAVPYGSIQRGANAADMPLGAFVTTRDYTLLSADSFAYNLRDGRLGVTLLRSPIYGDLRIFPIDTADDYDILGQGLNEGRLSLIPVALAPADAVMAADAFVNPPIVIDEAAHPGTDCPTHSFGSVEGKSTVLTVWKPAEDGCGTVVRLAEYGGIADAVTLRLGDAEFAVNMQPYEIKTLLLAEGVLRDVDMLEGEIPG